MKLFRTSDNKYLIARINISNRAQLAIIDSGSPYCLFPQKLISDVKPSGAHHINISFPLGDVKRKGYWQPVRIFEPTLGNQNVLAVITEPAKDKEALSDVFPVLSLAVFPRKYIIFDFPNRELLNLDQAQHSHLEPINIQKIKLTHRDSYTGSYFIFHALINGRQRELLFDTGCNQEVVLFHKAALLDKSPANLQIGRFTRQCALTFRPITQRYFDGLIGPAVFLKNKLIFNQESNTVSIL